ncbi:multiple antibiotic resistance/MarC-related protein [Candidatus Moduliflexus flocculans]|uniref:UPF0056 membrane protein n=1 Tax=Candidatus Moduliflexus flocculans TaxID=1499966 RepID=A0A081BPA5_9BACT|nr:multiple antibiotic resistance/MarC-related protein [Candidatus Moduliflexus flocculans]
MNIISDAITLLLVMDPFGNIPPFLSILSHVEATRRRQVLFREMLFALGILCIFLFFGKYLLDAMHISEPALTISGGFILFLIAIRMIFPFLGTVTPEMAAEEPFIVPLAIPMVAGPSTMVTLILIASRPNSHRLFNFFALFAAWIVSSFILVLSERLASWLGDKVLKAIERFMGMILTTMAVQMLLDGIQHYIEFVH